LREFVKSNCPRFTESFARGVGNNPDPIAGVRGTNGGSRYAVPLRIEPDLGQVAEYPSKPIAPSSLKKVWDVFHDEEPGSKLASESDHLGPEPATRPVNSSLRSGAREVLAGEPSADDIDGNSICRKPLGGKLSDILVPFDVGPMLLENSPAERVDLALRDGDEAARPLKTKLETANAGEEAQNPECGCGASSTISHIRPTSTSANHVRNSVAGTSVFSAARNSSMGLLRYLFWGRGFRD
jgi:hypothetical protein